MQILHHSVLNEWTKNSLSGGQLPQLKFRIADSYYVDNHAFDCGNRIVLPESHFWEAKVRPRILQCFSISKFWSIKQLVFQWYQGWLMIKILCVESYRAASNDVCLASSRAIMVMEHSGGLCFTLLHIKHIIHTAILSCLGTRVVLCLAWPVLYSLISNTYPSFIMLAGQG